MDPRVGRWGSCGDKGCQEALKQDGQGVRVAAAVSVAGTVTGSRRSAGAGSGGGQVGRSL